MTQALKDDEINRDDEPGQTEQNGIHMSRMTDVVCEPWEGWGFDRERQAGECGWIPNEQPSGKGGC